MSLLNWLVGLFRLRPPVPPTPPSPPEPPSPDPASNVTRCIAAMNAERRKAGLPNLGRDDRLCQAAQIQADYCAPRDLLTHTGPGVMTLLDDRVGVFGYEWSKLAENAAQQPKAPPGWPGGDPRTPEWAVSGWMQSSGHRANLLGPYTQVGAAYADAASGTRYTIAVYAVPAPVHAMSNPVHATPNP